MTPGCTVAEAAGAQVWAEADEAAVSEAATASPAMRLFFMEGVNACTYQNLRKVGPSIFTALHARLDRSHEFPARVGHAARHRGAAPARRRGAGHRARLRPDARAARALP